MLGSGNKHTGISAVRNSAGSADILQYDASITYTNCCLAVVYKYCEVIVIGHLTTTGTFGVDPRVSGLALCPAILNCTWSVRTW